MPLTRAPRRVLAAAAGGLLLVSLLAACGGDDSDSASDDVVQGNTTTTKAASDPYGYGDTGDATTTTTAALAGGAGEGEQEAAVVATDFKLTSVTAAPGAEVGFQNQGANTHTLTANNGSFDTGNVASGESASITAPTAPGSYAFHCKIHASMTGTLTVS